MQIRIALLLVVTSALGAGRAGAADAPLQLPPDVPAMLEATHFETAEDVDLSLRALGAVVWDGGHVYRDMGPDFRGRNSEADLADVVLPRDVQTQLISLRDRAARQAGDTDALRKTLTEAEVLVMRQRANMLVLGFYASTVRGPMYRHHELIEAQLLRVGDPEAQTARAKLAREEQQTMDTLLANAPALLAAVRTQDLHAVQAVFAPMGQLVTVYNNERARLAALPGRDVESRIYRDRKQPCPAPASAGSGRSTPWLSVVESEPTDQFYPQDLQKLAVEGRVVVEVSIAADGCVQRVRIGVSSGVPELDEAALQYAERGARFRPAEVDGQRVEGDYRFMVSFKLQDAPQSSKGGK